MTAARPRPSSSAGVEITQEPVDQFYGVDAGFRDPSGNQHRLVQRRRWRSANGPRAAAAGVRAGYKGWTR